MIRHAVQSAAVAVATFAVVTGSIVGVGLMGHGASADVRATLEGDWVGAGVQVSLDQSGEMLSGLAREGEAATTVEGSVRGRNVTLTRAVADTSGAVKSVLYTGKLDASGTSIRGVFDAGGVTGQFELIRKI
jgi:hypothetical protein